MRHSLSALLLISIAADVAAAQTIDAEPRAAASISSDKASASVVADSAACARSTKITLARVRRHVTADGRPGTGRSLIGSARVDATCRWWISGLDMGEYEVELAGPGESGGMASFTATPGSSQEIEIPVPAVRVTGTIQINRNRAIG